MKCEIDIDLGQFADEWEPVAYRIPHSGEHFISGGCVTSCGSLGTSPRLIVRRRWHWPEWLTAEWIAMDENGQWFGYKDEPKLCYGSWLWSNQISNLFLTTFTPPPCTDWTQSKRRNPNGRR